ncbi:putative DD41D transposase [Trichonephila clavipes]|nr:putative DD41D transposase [Trichonephila clavipes]
MSDNEQRCAIKFYFKLGHNAMETFAKLQQAYGDSVLLRAQFFRWFKAFSEERESIEDEPHSGRPSVSKSAENVVRTCAFRSSSYTVTDQLKAIPISEFHQSYEEWKKRLPRCVASEGSYFEGDNVESCQVIYSQFGLAINQNDHQARRRFAEWAQNEIAIVPDFHKRILFTNEAHFWLNSCVNKQNCRIWSEANPQVYVETPLHPETLTVWGAFWASGIIGPYFFKNDAGYNVTVKGDRYRTMITNFFIPQLNNHDVQELWFQQDGATCHTARATIDLLKDTFGYRVISRFGPVN